MTELSGEGNLLVLREFGLTQLWLSHASQATAVTRQLTCKVLSSKRTTAAVCGRSNGKCQGETGDEVNAAAG